MVIRALDTNPGALNFIHAEVQNLAVGVFPSPTLPACLRRSLVGHVLAIRSLRSGLRAEAGPRGGSEDDAQRSKLEGQAIAASADRLRSSSDLRAHRKGGVFASFAISGQRMVRCDRFWPKPGRQLTTTSDGPPSHRRHCGFNGWSKK